MAAPDKILSARQIRECDAFTVTEQRISSIELMERAATQCVEWLCAHYPHPQTFHVICGTGNNGGEGMVIARQLHQRGYPVTVHVIHTAKEGSVDFQHNEKIFRKLAPQHLYSIHSTEQIPNFGKQTILIDCIFGTGLNKPAGGIFKEVIQHMNATGASIISIDLPSGLLADDVCPDKDAIVKANITLSFQTPKLAFLFPENDVFVGHWEVLNIGLSATYFENVASTHFLLNETYVASLLRSRTKFSHKGTYGHACMLLGSYGKMGAAVLATQACLKSGAGLTSVQVPACGVDIVQISCPEAMVLPDASEKMLGNYLPEVQQFTLGIGPGIGTDETTGKMLHQLLEHSTHAMVIDADALNLLAAHPEWKKSLPQWSILTPHPKEFERLVGKAKNNFERHDQQRNFSMEHHCYVVLKGAHTCITTPEGRSYFNTTGNPGMAKGGSGDVLTGLLTGLLAQGYNPEQAALLGVYLHGLAGDLCKKQLGEEGMTAMDIVEKIPIAFKTLHE